MLPFNNLNKAVNKIVLAGKLYKRHIMYSIRILLGL